MNNSYDVAILGAGPGGYVAAIRAAQLGFSTAVIEKDKSGGICLNWGCIPTKALLKNAEILHNIKHSSEFGISIENYSVDFSKIIRRSRDISDKISKNVDGLLKKNGVENIKGTGRIINASGPVTLEIKNNGESREVKAEKLIIATGAGARILPSVPVDRMKVITSTEALALKEIPESMIIVGAGAIGVEFAFFYNTLGTKVTIIEVLSNVLPLEDEEVSRLLLREFRKQGIEVLLNSRVLETETAKNGSVTVSVETPEGKKILNGKIVLSAAGVTGNIDGIGLENTRVKTEKGFISVNKSDYMTENQNIYAVGDVIGPPLLAHVASAEAINCVEKLSGLNVPDIDYGSIPACTFCQPQVASIGMTEHAAREAGLEIKVGKFPFTASGRAFAAGERDGFVKLIFDAKYGELLGAHIIGSSATEILEEAVVAKSHGATAESIIKTIHSHPTFSEAIMEAAAAAYGEAIHI